MPSPRLWTTLASLAFGTILQAQVTLNLANGTGDPGDPVTVNLTLGGGANPAAVGFDLSINPGTAVSYGSSDEGPVAVAADKDITCSPNGGVTKCVIFGLNNNTMANGVVATITFNIQSGTTATSAAVSLTNLSASTALGGNLGITANGGTITIIQPTANQAPVATGKSVSTNEDTNLPITLNATDPDGNPLTYQIMSQPSKGAISGGSSANRTYTPNANATGADSFTFRASDGSLNSNIATINITINPVNDAPTATGSSVSTNEDTPLPITLSASDVDGNPLTYQIMSQPSKGTLSGGTGATRTYTPTANANGADSFTFRANDGSANSNTVTVNITINPVNDAPTTTGQSLSTQANTPLNLTLTGSDVDGDALTYSVGAAAHGTVSGGSGAGRTYTPTAGYTGPDSFTYQVSDNKGGVANGTISINVTNAPNGAPTATGATLPATEDTPLNLTLNATDPDSNPLTYQIMSAPTKGTLSGGTGAARTYTPNANANGADSFTFRANDGSANSNTATVTINIAAVNDPPTTSNQSLSTAADTPLGITLTGSDVDGDALTYSVGAAAHGTVSGGSGAGRTYTPTAGYTGPDSFSFQVSDNKGGVANGTVSINVTGSSTNNPPATDPIQVTTNEDTPKPFTVTGTDPDGDPVGFTVMTQPAKGTVSGTAPNLMFVPTTNANGPDSFKVRASDGRGGISEGTVNIMITPVNDAPTADNQSVSTAQNTAKPITLTGSDVDGDALSYSISTAPAHGTVSGGTGSGRIYTPANGYVGPDSFQFKVDDNKGGMATATVTINVTGEDTPENKPPTATDESVTTNVDTPKAITLKGSDPDGDALTFSVTGPPSNGTLSGSAPNLTYTPNSGYQGPDSIAFRVDDPNGGNDTGTISINVVEPNQNGINLTSVDCTGNELTGGGSRTCHVYINKRAPNGGVNVNLTCQTDQIEFPNSVRIGSRSTSARFKIYSPLIETAETVELTATLANSNSKSAAEPVALGGSVSTRLTLVPLQPTSLSCDPVQLTSGDTFTCRATLNSSSFSENVNLAITSSTADVQVPTSLRVRSGRTSASFRGSSSQSAKQQSATVGAALHGNQVTSTLSIVTEQAPSITVDTPQVTSTRKQLAFNVRTKDPNDLPVTLSASDVPQGASFQSQSGRFTWTPSESQVGTHLVKFQARNSANAVAEKTVTIDVINGTMKIYGFTNSASSWGGFPCSPGSLATIWGVGFTDGSSERARRFPLPTSLNGVRVEVNNRDARLLYVGEKQINMQCPFLRAGEELSIEVERTDTGATANWSVPGVSMREATPAIFSVDGSGTGQGLVLGASSAKLAMYPTPDTDGQAVEPGDHLIIYANGLGLVSPEVPAGEPAAASPLSEVVATVRVRIGHVLLPVTFAGLVPDLAGVYQVNTVLSDSVPTGSEVPMSLEVQLPDGTLLQSNIVTIAIQEGAPRFSE